jgi:TPR repeat protein
MGLNHPPIQTPHWRPADGPCAMMMRRLLTVPLLALLLATPAWAGFDEGLAAYKRGDHAAALREFRPLAEQGNPTAQFFLFYMFNKGLGVPSNILEGARWARKARVKQGGATAAKWFKKAAEQGNVYAQNALGWMYRSGFGIPEDRAEAAKWYRQAAEQGDSDSQFVFAFMHTSKPPNYAVAFKWFKKAAEQGDYRAFASLGYLYEKGLGTPQDFAEAASWHVKSAEEPSYGNRLKARSSMLSLGNMYYKGQGVLQDYVRAHMWWNTAASRGDKEGAKDRDRLAKKMTPADISKAQRMARDWVAKFETRKKMPNK